MEIDRATVLAFLRQHSVAVLATADEKGVPEAAVIEYCVKDDLEIIFDTYTTYRKYANLLINPRVCICRGMGSSDAAI